MTAVAASYVNLAHIEAKVQAAAAEAELEADPDWEALGAVAEAEQLAAVEAVKRRSWRLEAIATLDSRAADDQFRPLIQVVVCVSDEVVSVIPAGKTPS